MTNKTYHNYMNAFSASYWGEFKKYCDSIPNFMHVDQIYGCKIPNITMLKDVMKSFAKDHVMFNDEEEVGEYLDINTYDDESLAQFLEWQRKNAKKWGYSFYHKNTKGVKHLVW